MVVQLVARDELCRRLMTVPGVGPVTALTFSTAIDDPKQSRRSRDVAAYFGLTSKRWQSDTSIDVRGHISKAGDPEVRRALCEVASAVLTRYKGKTALKNWGQKIAKMLPQEDGGRDGPQARRGHTRCGATVRSMRIGRMPVARPTTPPTASLWALTHDADRPY
jgi:hypothetical protein